MGSKIVSYKKMACAKEGCRMNPGTLAFCQHHRSDDHFPECSICLRALRRSTAQLLCSHSFHRTCLFKWLSKSNTCPMCREIVTGIQIGAHWPSKGEATAWCVVSNSCSCSSTFTSLTQENPRQLTREHLDFMQALTKTPTTPATIPATVIKKVPLNSEYHIPYRKTKTGREGLGFGFAFSIPINRSAEKLCEGRQVPQS